MAVPFPHIPENETVTELFDVLLNPTKFKERVEAQIVWHDSISKMLDRYKEWGEIEDARNKAASLVAEAKKIKAQADEYAKEEKQRADKHWEAIEDEAGKILEKAKEKEAFLDKLESVLQAREKELDQLQIRTEAKQKEAEEALTQALAAKGRAEKAEQFYNGKIAKIQEISAGE